METGIIINENIPFGFHPSSLSLPPSPQLAPSTKSSPSKLISSDLHVFVFHEMRRPVVLVTAHISFRLILSAYSKNELLSHLSKNISFWSIGKSLLEMSTMMILSVVTHHRLVSFTGIICERVFTFFRVNECSGSRVSGSQHIICPLKLELHTTLWPSFSKTKN